MLEQDAKRLFALHSPLIRRCIERFSTYARDDGNGRVALGFMPLSPDKYMRLSQIYQTVHNLMVCFYHLHREGSAETSLEDWVNLLQFDPVVLRCNQGWDQEGRLDCEMEEQLRGDFDTLAVDVLAFRRTHLKEIMTFARQEAEHAARHGQRDAESLFQAVSDQFLQRQSKYGQEEEIFGKKAVAAAVGQGRTLGFLTNWWRGAAA